MIDDLEGVRLPDGFVVYFPVWVILDEKGFRAGGLEGGLSLVRDESHGTFLPLFTDKEQGEEVVRADGVPGKVVVPLENKGVVWALMKLCDPVGVNHVGIDVTYGHPFRGRFYPYADLRDTFPHPA